MTKNSAHFSVLYRTEIGKAEQTPLLQESGTPKLPKCSPRQLNNHSLKTEGKKSRQRPETTTQEYPEDIEEIDNWEQKWPPHCVWTLRGRESWAAFLHLKNLAAPLAGLHTQKVPPWSAEFSSRDPGPTNSQSSSLQYCSFPSLQDEFHLQGFKL